MNFCTSSGVDNQQTYPISRISLHSFDLREEKYCRLSQQIVSPVAVHQLNPQLPGIGVFTVLASQDTERSGCSTYVFGVLIPMSIIPWLMLALRIKRVFGTSTPILLTGRCGWVDRSSRIPRLCTALRKLLSGCLIQLASVLEAEVCCCALGQSKYLMPFLGWAWGLAWSVPAKSKLACNKP